MPEPNKPPENTPEAVIDIVIHSIRAGQGFELKTEELKTLSANKDMLKRKMEGLTKNQLLELRRAMEEEREEAIHEDSDIRETAKEIADLMEIERDIEAVASATMSAETVADIGEIPESEKTLLDKVKDRFRGFESFGALVKGWIAIKKMLMPLSQNKTADEGSIKFAEKLYGMFFGEAEMRTTFNNFFKEKGVKLDVVKGKKDASAYAALQSQYLGFINPLIGEKKGDDRKAIEEANPVEAFLKNLATEYSVPNDGKQYETTLQGIAQKQQPKERPAEAPRFAV
jgi:hypothetical protein